MSASSLVLIGAPAAGKTIVGRIVAERAGLDFIDTDELLAQRLGLSLPEAWATVPPREIAAVEAAVCAQALAKPAVVALGSAAVADHRIRAALVGLPVVWLEVSAAQASRRLGMAALGMDTLLALRGRLDALLRQRRDWYEAASTVRVDTDRRSIEAVVAEVEQAWAGGR